MLRISVSEYLSHTGAICYGDLVGKDLSIQTADLKVKEVGLLRERQMSDSQINVEMVKSKSFFFLISTFDQGPSHQEISCGYKSVNLNPS